MPAIAPCGWRPKAVWMRHGEGKAFNWGARVLARSPLTPAPCALALGEDCWVVQKRIQHFTLQEMHAHALKTFEDIGDDEELGPADWSTVKAYLHCLDVGLSPPAGGGAHHAGWIGGAEALLRPFHPHHPSHTPPRAGPGPEEEAGAVEEGQAGRGTLLGRIKSRAYSVKKPPSVEVVREQQLQDTRLRFLNGTLPPRLPLALLGPWRPLAASLLRATAAESTSEPLPQSRRVHMRPPGWSPSVSVLLPDPLTVPPPIPCWFPTP